MTTLPKDKAREYQRRWRTEHRGQALAWRQEYYQKFKQKLNENPELREKNREYSRRWAKAHPQKNNERKKLYYAAHKAEFHRREKECRKELRAVVFHHYKNKCACCGETKNEFLGIDHIGGVKPGEKKRRGPALLAWLIKNNFPPGFRILCHNCNLAHGFYGYCPHDKERPSPDES